MSVRKILVALSVLLFIFPGCRGVAYAAAASVPAAPARFVSYRDVPGVTQSEIDAIEKLKQTHSEFIFAMVPSTESFEGDGGQLHGFSALLCDWLTEMFGVSFTLKLYEWNGLLEALESGDAHFTGDLTATEERRKTYVMTSPIAERVNTFFRMDTLRSLADMNERRYLRLGFYKGASTEEVFNESGRYTFYPYYFDNHKQASDALINGVIDAVVGESVSLSLYKEYIENIEYEDIFPPSYSSVSLSTRDKSLSPIISVMQKIIDNGGSRTLSDLYNEGLAEYQTAEFFASLTESERRFMSAQDNVLVVMQHDDYPVSFYNEHESQWQGVATDVLAEITKLTGINFRVVNETDSNLQSLGRYVTGGVADFIAGVSSEDALRMRLVPSGKAIASDTYAFISDSEFNDLRLNEVLNARVGVVNDTAHQSLFKEWFPGHRAETSYLTWDDAYDALINHEVDLVLSSRSRLSFVTNYREEVGHKVNLSIDYPFDSVFAFNGQREELRGIINKALELVDAEGISEGWVRRTYNYRVQSEQRTQVMLTIGYTIAVLIITTAVAIILSNRQRKVLKLQVEQRTEELALQSTTMTSILECMPDLVFCKDNELKYTRLNKSFEKFFGVTERDIVGKSVDALISNPEVAKQSELQAQTAINDRRVVSMEETHRNHFGNKYIFETVRTPLVLHNKVIGVVGILHNITRLKAIEKEAHDASQAKSAFLANMSHEIRTPMNSIVGFSELALDEELSPKAKDYVSKIMENSDWLLQIINDILDISKIESGKMDLESIPFDLHEVFSRCQTMITPKAIEKGIQLYCYAEPSVGRRLLGDPTRLKQALINILSNAVKFTNVGMVKMSSSILETTGDSATVYFEIKDSGIGMTPEQAAKIFDPFTQADSSTTRRYGGTGLGLAITKNIIEMMGGKLELSSVPNVGTKFSFKVTFKTAEMSDADTRPDIVLSGQKMPAFDGEVLLCEDNNMNQQVITEHLRRVGLRTVVAGNGKEGLDFVAARAEAGEPPFDLIFMDIHMPVMDGIEAAAAITKLNAGTPIVALTANIMTNETDIYRQNGMSDYLGKPFKANELWRCLCKYLKQVEPRGESSGEDEGIQRKIRQIFARDNKNRYREIAEAIGTGDIKLAHRLAHTLKGNAGMLNERNLQEAAKSVETSLKEGRNNVTRQQMETLRAELDRVLQKLLPLQDDTDGFEDEETSEPAAAEGAVNTVLVVDDERVNLAALSNILSGDYTVYTARGGKDAIRKACELRPRLILLDVLMPDMDGYEVIARLKSMEETKQIPVIFVTGLSDAGDEERGLALSAADYIPKPFSPAIVKLRVNNQMRILEQMETIERMSLLDQLTGIANRRSFDGRFHAEWVRAVRDRTAVGLMIIDIDNFKKHNDTYGHQQGDRALQYVTAAISGTLKRAGDFAARWGGEEFVVLLPNTDTEGAFNVAEKIRSAVEGINILLEDGGVTHLTVSVGLSVTTPTADDSPDAFISRADRALYEAKRTGKNRVCGE